jgi:GTPase Era involved in 16S rRNA processing
LENLYFWSDLSQNKAPDNCKRILIGNKSDLVDEGSVTFDQGKYVQKQINSIAFFEVSALDSSNVKTLVQFIAHDILDSGVNSDSTDEN